MTMATIGVVAGWSSVPAVAWAGSPVGLSEQVDRLMADYDRPNYPGAAAAVYLDGQIVHAKGYGLADQEGRVAATDHTNYRLASVTKAFTAMAIMILKERGQLTYDQKLTDVLPEFPAYGRAITIRHLLNHTSGLHDYENLIPSNQDGQVSDHDVVGLLADERSTYFTPGSSYRYSNSGYCTLGVIVAKVSGMPFHEFLAQNVFEPLAMTGSLAYVNGSNDVQDRAYGYTWQGSRYQRTDQSVTSATLGDGGVYTSVAEYFLWDQALYGERLVSAPTLAEAFTSGTLNNGSRTGYGFGWKLDTYRGVKRISHTGSTIGFRTAVQRFPDKKLTVVVLINRANTAPWDLAQSIADLYW
jgi:CubicO group peptidase (beta-lactamase class C family)